ncbi:Fc.00g007410.m01.CDS01 [Cosmosporella sp. VM-42]
MGPPRTRRPLSASRFHEGSMNDRASNAPPVAFLGPAERARLEKPVRPMSDDWADKQVKKNRLLGQVWDGVRGRLGLRREPSEEKRVKKSEKLERKEEERPGKEDVMASYQQLVASGFFSSTAIPSARQPGPAGALNSGVVPPVMQMPTPKASSSQLRPTKEEVMENYHHLVASGFFSSHAIQSTRVPGRAPTPTAGRAPTPAPGRVPTPTPTTAQHLTTTSTSTAPRKNATRSPSPTRPSHDSLRPRWPLLHSSRTATPSTSRAPSPMRSPASASSRGTKRAAIDTPSDEENEDPPTPKKKLRKSASRDISIPKLRNVASRKAILTRRSVSGPHGGKETNRLAKRVLGRFPGGSSNHNATSKESTPRGSLEAPAARRCASGMAAEERRGRLQEASTRVLRPRKSANEGLSVVPDANRGIPNVPAIPAKFTYGEDRENNGPWRDRLRRQYS